MGRKIQYYDHLTPKLGNISGLTERRAQVLELVACGLTTEDIAAKLGISEDTVKSHLDHLRLQFAALNRVELIYQACAHGVLRIEHPPTFSLELVKKGAVKTIMRLPRPTIFALDHYFHRAQARLRTRRSVGVSLGQKAVAPVFEQPNEVEPRFYDMPAYLRKRIRSQDFDNQCRVAAYADRVRAHIQQVAQ